MGNTDKLTFFQSIRNIVNRLFEHTSETIRVSVPGGITTTPISGNETGGTGSLTVTEATALGGDVTVKETVVTNYTADTVLYVGTDISVSAANGQPLNYLDSYVSNLSNLNKIFLVSSSSSDVRYSYEN